MSPRDSRSMSRPFCTSGSPFGRVSISDAQRLLGDRGVARDRDPLDAYLGPGSTASASIVAGAVPERSRP